MTLFDTHCHIHEALRADADGTHTQQLWHKSGLTLDDIVENGRNADVSEFILVGSTFADSESAVQIAPKYEGARVSIGIHPHEASDALTNNDLERFAKLAENPVVSAIGEFGLDYFYEHSPKEAQLELLEFQLDLCSRHDLPAVFHVREAYDDFWPIFERYTGIRGVLHSYTDSRKNLERALAHGLYIGVNGIATFARGEEQQAMYQAIPLERLLLETDAPYLTPVPHRGKINQLQHVRDVAEWVSVKRQLTLEEVASATTTNAHRLFDTK